MSPLGHYPNVQIRTPSARLLYDTTIAFTVVKTRPEEFHGLRLEHYSDFQSLSLEETRFLAALSMALRPDHGMIYAYPLADSATVPGDCSEEHLFHCAQELKQKVLSHPYYEGVPLYPERTYEHNAAVFDLSLLSNLLKGIDLRDHVLMRGLGAIVQAQMLWTRREFGEAATLMLFVALEASFQIVCDRLRETGNPSPSHKDAGEYLQEEMGEDFYGRTEGYFTEWYEARIKSMHPASRLGTFPFPPLEADDFYLLRSAMLMLYAFLCSRHKWQFG